MLFQIISILVLHSVCGAVLPPITDLIVDRVKNVTSGGVSIDITEAPYNVAILDVVETTTRHHCGGSILRADTIVTSGFCIYFSVPPGEYPHRSMVKAGTNFHGFGGQQIWVKEMILHPDFNHESYKSNIGIIILEKDIKFGSVAAPVLLPEYEIPEPNTTENFTHGELTGWSKTSNGGKSENLLKFIIPLSDQVRCKLLYPDDVICADVAEDVDDEDACFGDVGNPLVVDGVLLGITLWSFDCGTPESPWIFTRVAPYVDWLNPPTTTTTEEPTTTTEIDTTYPPTVGPN